MPLPCDVKLPIASYSLAAIGTKSVMDVRAF